MKIVQVLFNKKYGGVEQCFVDYCQALTESGYEVHNIIQKGALYKNNLKRISKNIYEINSGWKGNLYTLFRIWWRVLRSRPDVVICHTGKSAMFVKFATWCIKKFPVIGIDHGEKAMNYIKYHKADYVFCVNSWMTGQVNKVGKEFGVRAFHVPNMVHLGKVKLERKKWHKPITIGVLSRISGEKVIDKTIKAVDILRKNGYDVQFLIAGKGVDRLEKEYKALVKELKLSKYVKFLGWVKNKKKFFEKIDIYCMPSLAETFGISYLNAMKYSTPIIASNSWGPSDIFRHEENGLIIPTSLDKDELAVLPNKIAKEIEKLIKDKVLARYLTINAFRDLKEKYTIEKNGKLIDKNIKFIVKDWYNKTK
jgi:glycosyltransferase involved in cell wall biosynthesis